MLPSRRAVLVLCLLPVIGGVEGLGTSVSARQKFQKFASADVTFDYPDNWEQMTLPPPTRAAFRRNAELSFVVNRAAVDYPEEFNEAFAALEVKSVPDDFPGATAITSRAIAHPVLGRILQIDFTRTAAQSGRNTRPLHLRLFAIPAGRFIYRIICTARADEFASRHEPVFKRMIDSLVITPPAAKQVAENGANLK